MSEYGFGYYEGEQSEEQPPMGEPQGGSAIKQLREKAKADSEALKQMRTELDQLRSESRRNKVAEVLRSKGYDPGAAELYSGEPEKVDEWLANHGSLLAKRPDVETASMPQAQQGPPASAVSTEDQAAMQRMQSAGSEGVAGPLGSQDEIAAALSAAKSPQEFEQVARANGWSYSLDGLFG